MSSRLSKVIQTAGKLHLEELYELDAWLHEQIQLLEEEQARPIPKKDGSEVLEERQIGAITYRLELVKCGKASCHCAKGGDLHGPYWYGYWWDHGKTRKTYVGKSLPSKKE